MTNTAHCLSSARRSGKNHGGAVAVGGFLQKSPCQYSNMEIAFLLQKMEEYDGVSILATNYLQNFDNASMVRRGPSVSAARKLA